MAHSRISAPERRTYRTYTFFGGIIGLLAYLAVGLLPSLVYGGFAGVALASAMLGGPLDASLLGRGLVVFGMVVGLLGTAAVFTVVGGALGAGAYAVVGARHVSSNDDARHGEAEHLVQPK